MLKKVIVTVMAVLTLSACGEKKSELVQLKGSDTILNASQGIAEEFMKENKNARVAVTGGGSGVGIAAKINGTTNIAMASRTIKSSELEKAEATGVKLDEIVLGYDGITVITNKENSLRDLNSEVLGKIYSGEITNWKQVGGEDTEIVVLSRDSSSGTHAYFKEEIVRSGDKKSEKEYGSNTLYMPSNEAIKQEVKQNKYSIGYIGMGYMDDSVKSLSVDGIAPSFENVSSKAYPIARAVYWYADSNRDGVVEDLVDFALSSKGQAVVKSEGFVPAN